MEGPETARISVVISAFNAAGDVESAVRSIQEQTYRDWELIVVDDCSTDGTGRLLDAIAATDRRVKIIHCDRNIGQAACLNLGWRMAKTDLIARMDADDISLPTRLERQAEFMESNPSVAVLGSAAILVDAHGNRLGIASRPEEHPALAATMYKETPFIHPSVVVRRSFLEALDGYAPYLRRAQDLDLWLKGYRRFRYHNLPEALIEYRVRHRQSLRTILEGTFVLARSSYRENLLLRRGWYAPRYFAAALLAKFGLRKISFG